ncbi:chromate resistance protein (plasmid) [Burkholderia sp. KK1]|nr:chromate resistance protein [Burkholderia sp. KK1]
MKWVTREHPKVDRIACPWLVQRFIDPDAEFLFVPRDDVMRIAAEMDATPYDVPNVELGHHGELCSFDAFLDKFQVTDPALHKLASIVRGADTGRLDLAPEATGLYAVSIGLSRTFSDDHEQLRCGMLVYDALYAWCNNNARVKIQG